MITYPNQDCIDGKNKRLKQESKHGYKDFTHLNKYCIHHRINNLEYNSNTIDNMYCYQSIKQVFGIKKSTLQ